MKLTIKQWDILRFAYNFWYYETKDEYEQYLRNNPNCNSANAKRMVLDSYTELYDELEIQKF